MRAYPLALLKDDYTYEDCMITNPSSVCIECISIYVTILKNIMSGYKDNMMDYVSFLKGITIKNKCVKNAIYQGLAGKNRVINGKNKGWICHAIYCVFLFFSKAWNKYSDYIDHIISLGGDTDTNASICGVVVGLYFGYENMIKDYNTFSNIDILLSADPTLGNMGAMRGDNILYLLEQLYSMKSYDNFIISK
jgi:ADP-ribosylglycohydrolase